MPPPCRCATTSSPATEADGVTIDVPLATLNTVGAAPFTWNVPGLRQDLVTALIRSLPKRLRVNFVPAPDVARRFLEAVPPGEEPLVPALSRYLRSLTGVHVPEDAWDQTKVPDHLRPTFRVLDEQGAELGVGKDLEALKQPLRPSFDRAIRQVADESGISATGQTTWTFGTIEPSFTRTRAGPRGARFPDACRRGQPRSGCASRHRQDEQEANHRLGVRRLLLLAVPSPVGQMVESLDNHAKLALAASPYPNVRALVEDCVTAAAGELVDSREPVRDAEAFAALVEERASDASGRRQRRAAPGDPGAGGVEIGGEVAARPGGDVDAAGDDRPSRAARPPGAPGLRRRGRAVGAPGVPALPQGDGRAGSSGSRDQARDRELMDRIEVLQQAWQHRVDALAEGRPLGADLRRVRWMLEEYRVSLWAQHLGTAQPVSDARIRKALG